MALSITEVSAASGLRPSALRYYEEAGLIAPRERRGGRRYYDAAVLSRLAFIALCQDVGFTIAEIATLVDGGAGTRQRWQHLAEDKLEDIDSQLRKLRQMKRHLRSALGCQCGSVESCEVVEAAAHRRQLPLHPVADPSAASRRSR